MAATVHIVHAGYNRDDPAGSRVGSTVGLIVDGEARVIVDPGMVPSRGGLLDSLAAVGVTGDEVTDVVISHHHPDHTVNAGLFDRARLHDHWAWYRDDLWVSRPAEGFAVSPAVRLIETPGHTPQDISTLVETDGGLTVFTHLWWTEATPLEDPYASDPAALHANRQRILELPGLEWIVPGHGPPFRPGATTPR